MINDFTSFIWSIIEPIIEVIKSTIEFIKGIITFIPEHLSFLPDEIEVLFIPLIAIIIFISIYKFVK